MELAGSVLKHGISGADIRHAWRNAMRLVEYEYAGEDRLLVIGPSTDGGLLELVAVPTHDPARIIHADRLRPALYDYLR